MPEEETILLGPMGATQATGAPGGPSEPKERHEGDDDDQGQQEEDDEEGCAEVRRNKTIVVTSTASRALCPKVENSRSAKQKKSFRRESKRAGWGGTLDP